MMSTLHCMLPFLFLFLTPELRDGDTPDIGLLGDDYEHEYPLLFCVSSFMLPSFLLACSWRHLCLIALSPTVRYILTSCWQRLHAKSCLDLRYHVRVVVGLKLVASASLLLLVDMQVLGLTHSLRRGVCIILDTNTNA